MDDKEWCITKVLNERCKSSTTIVLEVIDNIWCFLLLKVNIAFVFALVSKLFCRENRKDEITIVVNGKDQSRMVSIHRLVEFLYSLDCRGFQAII